MDTEHGVISARDEHLVRAVADLLDELYARPVEADLLEVLAWDDEVALDLDDRSA